MKTITYMYDEQIVVVKLGPSFHWPGADVFDLFITLAIELADGREWFADSTAHLDALEDVAIGRR